MSYTIVFSEIAVDGIGKINASGDKTALNKLLSLIEELKEHPETGTGKPERLRNNLSGHWSRRISDKHRLIYRIEKETVTVFVVQCYGHYGDK